MDNNYYRGTAVTGPNGQPSQNQSPTAAFAAQRQAYINSVQNRRPVSPSVQLDQNGRPVPSSVQLDQNGRPVTPSVQLDRNGRPVSPSVQLDQYGRPVQSNTASSPTAAFAAQRQAAINAALARQMQNGRPVSPSVQLDQNGRPVRPSVQLQSSQAAPVRAGGPPAGVPGGIQNGKSGGPENRRAGGPPPGVQGGPPGRKPGGAQGMGRMGGPKGGPRPKIDKGTLKRLISMLFEEYRSALTLVIICMVVVSFVGAAPSVFTERIASIITDGLNTISVNHYTEKSQFVEVYRSLRPQIIKTLAAMIVIFIIGLAGSFLQTRLTAVITQGFLYRLRKKVFAKMQSLPIKYFDTHNHGDIMSYYTNDIDTLRQLLSQALPNVISSAITITVLLCVMLYYSLWLTLTVGIGVCAMFMVTKIVGGNSARFFMQQQMSLGRTEGFIEEMIHGQKVVKVFCHEDISKKDFDRLNEQLFEDARSANKFANILMPIMGNIGNILYVLVAFVGGVFALNGWINPSVRAITEGEKLLTIPVIITYLNMTRQFCQNISQVSQQINAVAMALAGADRVFRVLDEPSEQDEGYVELVNAVNRKRIFN